MRKTVSPQARQRLHEMIRETILNLETSQPFIEPMLDTVCEWYEAQNTFTDAITEENQGMYCETMPCCGAKICKPKEEETEEHDFKGVAYEKDIDQKALQQGFCKVFEFMASHVGWHLDTEIADRTGVYVPSVQRYRSYMRQPEYGGHTVERRRRAGCRIFEYQLIPNYSSKIFKRIMQDRKRQIESDTIAGVRFSVPDNFLKIR